MRQLQSQSAETIQLRHRIPPRLVHEFGTTAVSQIYGRVGSTDQHKIVIRRALFIRHNELIMHSNTVPPKPLIDGFCQHASEADSPNKWVAPLCSNSHAGSLDRVEVPKTQNISGHLTINPK